MQGFKWDTLPGVRIIIHYMGLDARKPAFGGVQITKVQTSLISAFIIRILESIISKLATNEILIF